MSFATQHNITAAHALHYFHSTIILDRSDRAVIVTLGGHKVQGRSRIPRNSLEHHRANLLRCPPTPDIINREDCRRAEVALLKAAVFDSACDVNRLARRQPPACMTLEFTTISTIQIESALG